MYRHELKYYIHQFDKEKLQLELSQIMDVDRNQSDNGYSVSSLYFDTLYNRFFDENEAGVNERKKIRIRKYNDDNNVLKIEIKSKKDSLCLKESNIISLETTKKMLNLPYDDINDYSNPTLSRVLLANRLLSIRPAVIIDYDRYALIHKTGNVRITFDSNIKGNMYINKFLDNDHTGINILNDDYSILEVKYDDILPNYISNILDKYNLNQIAFSKYYLCRKAIGV